MPRPRSVLPALLIGLLFVVTAMPAAAWVHHPRDAKQQIFDLEQQWRTATLNADVPLMDKLLSDDFVGISWTGQVNNKMSQLQRLKGRNLAITKMDVFDQKVKVVGAVAIVTSRAEIEGSNDGVPMIGTFRYTRVYQHLPTGAWKITNFEATRVPNGAHRHGRDLSPVPPPS